MTATNQHSVVNESIRKEIFQALASLEYGEVIIKVHAGKVIQIEVTSKKRFDALWRVEQGGGI